MNEFLKTKSQIERSTEWLKENGYINHPISAKDWELKNFTEVLQDGDLLDMGADGSFILHNALIKNISGRKVGIDLAEVTGTNRAEDVEYFQGDLMNTPFEDNSFDTIICASVIEHDVNFEVFAKEVSRLLRSEGNLLVSFDYAPEKIDTSLTKLYSLSWNILSQSDVINLIAECGNEGLLMTRSIDWTTKDMVITPQYCSPANCSYTFGLFEFVKQ